MPAGVRDLFHNTPPQAVFHFEYPYLVFPTIFAGAIFASVIGNELVGK
jgi:uncharacterized membrane protein